MFHELRHQVIHELVRIDLCTACTKFAVFDIVRAAYTGTQLLMRLVCIHANLGRMTSSQLDELNTRSPNKKTCRLTISSTISTLVSTKDTHVPHSQLIRENFQQDEPHLRSKRILQVATLATGQRIFYHPDARLQAVVRRFDFCQISAPKTSDAPNLLATSSKQMWERGCQRCTSCS